MIVLTSFAAALALAAFMAGAWLVQRRTGQSGWVDTIWSFAVGLVGAAVALAPVAAADWPTARQGLVAALALAWSLRLGLHIVGRTLRGGEDPRYKALHDEWGADFPRRLFWFLQIQAAAAFLLALSIFTAACNPAPFPNIGDSARRRDAHCGDCRRSDRRRATGALSERSPQQRPRLRCRALESLAPSQLFLRMARLGRLSLDRHRPPPRQCVWPHRARRPCLHVLVARSRLGHSSSRSTYGAFARRGV